MNQAQVPESEILLDNMFDSVACFDKELRCIFANKRFSDHFGFPLDELLGKTLHELGGLGKHQDIWDRHLKLVLETKRKQELRHEIQTAKGTRWLLTKMIPNNKYSVVTISSDITHITNS